MKICWDMIEGMKIGERNGHLRKGHYTYLEMDACAQCGEPYLMNKYKPTEYCCVTCGKLGSEYNHNEEVRNKIGLAQVGNTNHLGISHTEKTKKLLSIINTGELNGNWRGGKSFEPYCMDWTKEYKEFIKERDNYTCLNPYCLGLSDTLVVHHINYNKKNCQPNNLITVCNSCNSRANIDREWHESWYTTIMERRYNG